MNNTRRLCRFIAVLMLVTSLSPYAIGAGSHAADDELALAAALLVPQTTKAPGAPAGVAAQANLAADPADCINNGAWSAAINWTPHIPVSAANLPDGRILTFASNQRTSFPAGPEFTYAATWDPATGVFKEFNNASHDMFCGGITLMADGRVMVNGGRNEVPYVSLFDWRTNTWTRIQNMNGGRWYNTSVSLPNGSVFTGNGSGTGIDTSERWNTAGWTVLTGLGWPAITGADAGYFKHWHPFVSVAPDGRLLHFGPTDTMHWFNTEGTGSFTNAGANVPGVHYPKEGCWVMYDEGKVLVAGGGVNTTASTSDTSIGISTNAAYTVDMNTIPPTVTATASMQYPRQFANTVVLPSGEVLVMGGNSPGQKFSDVGSILPCEIWNPRTGTWRTVASISVPRNYHSLALLLPDGRVLSGGGGLGGGDHRDAQLYRPPCLFTSTGAAATRPVLNTAPTKIGPGSIFNVTGTAGLVKFAFIRMAALTHSVNTDQRYLSLPFTETATGSYQVSAHQNINVMTPGYWMLFGINSTGAYSLAKTILVDAASGLVVNNPGPQNGIVGKALSLPITATAPSGTVLTYSATGLPSGLVIHPTTGVISGTPSSSGFFSSRITVSGGALSASQNVSWVVLLANTGTGSIRREWWLNIPGSLLSDLTSQPTYPATPAGSDLRPSFEAPVDWAENHGQRMRGFVTPPVSGQYRFWIASDDEGRLILSTDNTPANGSIIARVPVWTSSREWTRYPEQASALITLQAGQPYYIEALAKEGGGGDNLAVAWQMPGSTTPAVIEGQYLTPWQDNRVPVLTNPGTQVSVVGNSITLDVTASDADNDALVFSAVGLPSGLSIANDGTIAGLPTTTGTFSVTVRVTDNRSPAVNAVFTWTIRPQVELTPFNAASAGVAGSSVNFSAASSGGLNVRYQWNWGDGTPSTSFSSNANAAHTFAAPGRYQITLTATDDTGRITTFTFYQAVHAPLTALRPTASSSIVFEDRASGINDRVWCVNQDNNSVSVFDAVTRTRLAEINVGDAPRSLAIAPNGRVWVTNVEDGSVSIIDGSSQALVQTINLSRGSRPFGIAFDPDGSDGWIACEGSGQLLRMNPTTGAQLGALDVGLHARHVSVSADGARVFVTRFITPPMPGESTATINSSNANGGEVLSVLTSSFTVEKKTILLHSERPDTITAGRGIPNYLGPAIVSPDGLTAWVPSKQDNIKRGMLRDGSQLTHDQTIRSIASRIPLISGVPAANDDAAGRVDFDNAGIASNAVFDPKGIYLFTALEGSREVGIVDVWNKKEIRRFSAGRAPQGIAVSPDGRTVFTQNFMDRTITVHDVSAVVDGRDDVPTLVATLNCITTESLTPAVLLGKQHFYDSADPRIAFQQYISCASCHNDGGQDGRVWDFTGIGEGLRNTITLRGHGGTDQGPVHWTGNFDEIQDFENQLRTLPGGTGLIAGADPHPPLGTPNAGRSNDLDSLALYVSSLRSTGASPSRNREAGLPENAAAGREVFKTFGCASCHPQGSFTDSRINVLHDVGTLKSASGQRLGAALTGLDTPTLRGLFNTAPYLHDGSAATIQAAILAHTTVPKPAAGSDLEDLVAYLMNLDDVIDADMNAVNAALVATGSPVVTGATFTVTLTFANGIADVANTDLLATNCTVLGVSGSGTTWVVTLRAGNAGPMSVQYSKGGNASTVLNLTYDPPLPFVAKVNFQPAGAVIPAGYVADNGAMYGARSGLTYGWSTDHSDQVRDRNRAADQRQDTLIRLRTGARWELAVPNGNYDVTLGVGDASAVTQNSMSVEGVTAWSAQRFAAGAFAVKSVQVSVGDGRLTLANLAGSDFLTRLNFIDVVAVGATTVARGLRADYFAGSNFEQLRFSRIDSVIDFDWGSAAPDARVPADNFSVRWTGQITPRFTESHTFITTSDDGVRLWVNGVLIIDQWNDHAPTQHSGNITLTAGQPVTIKLEHYEKTGGTAARLEWQSANLERQVVPSERLQPNAGALYPTTFAAWVASGRVNANNPLGDSDGDGDLDLLEYALGGSAASGVQVSDALRLDTQTNGDVLASIVYPIGLSDVQFALEGSGDLRTWSDEAIIPQLTNLGDGTERRSWTNPVRSNVRLRVNHSSGAVAFSTPMTLQRLALHSGVQTLGIAALRAPVFAGVVDQVAGNALVLRDNASLVQAINTDARYYVEIRDGSYAGHRIDVQSVANGSVTLDTAAEHNTLLTVPAGLVGAHIVVRPHVTLGSAFNPDQWVGATSASAAEQVLSFRNGIYTSYWMLNGGPDPMRRSWLKVGSAALVSMNDTIIPPGTGLMVKVPTGARTFAITGQVRTNAFVQPLIAGHNFITSPWPVDASPASLGMNLPGAFTGSNRLTAADQIQTWKGELSGGTQGYQTYWLLDNQAGIRRWITTSDATLAPLDNVMLMPASRSFFFKAQPATAAQMWTMNAPAL